MKKIYMLLVLSFTGLQSVFAQFIWHPDLGTPHAGQSLCRGIHAAICFKSTTATNSAAQAISGRPSIRSSGRPVLRGSV